MNPVQFSVAISPEASLISSCLTLPRRLMTPLTGLSKSQVRRGKTVQVRSCWVLIVREAVLERVIQLSSRYQ